MMLDRASYRRALKVWGTALVVGILAVALLAFLTGCTLTVDSGPSDASKSADVAEHDRLGLTDPLPSVTDQPTVKPSKIAVLIGENKGYSQVVKNAWWKGIGEKYGVATNLKAMTHPSQGNYVWIAAGSQRGITSNSMTKITGRTIMGKTIDAGRSAMVFAQSMGSDNCRMTQRGYYHPRHSYGWVLFKDERALCEKYMVGYEKIKPLIDAGELPNLTLIVPNNCKNSHDCALSTAAAWFKTETERLMAGIDYQRGELVIVLTWDEDNGKEGNRIHTAVIHPSLSKKVVSTPLTLVSLHETLAAVGQVAPLGTRHKDTTALHDAFGISFD